MPIDKMTGSTPRPVTRMMRIAPMSSGKAKKASAVRITIESALPPRYPAIDPRMTPSRSASTIELSPTTMAMRDP
jgi:hypothetical protein